MKKELWFSNKMNLCLIVFMAVSVLLFFVGCVGEAGSSEQYGISLSRADNLMDGVRQGVNPGVAVFAQTIYQREMLMEMRKQTTVMERIADALEVIAGRQ